MTLIFPTPDDRDHARWQAANDDPQLLPSDPYTHLLVVGVAQYPHLLGGSAPLPDPLNFGLGQLESAAISARSFAEWCLRNRHGFTRPLGTVEMLLSEEKPGGSELNDASGSGEAVPRIDPPTRANLETAWARWKRRCNTSEENVAVVYYCGHGVRPADLILLTEDYGSSPYAFRGAWNFDKTRDGMSANRAHTRCYFIDACQAVSAEMLHYVTDADPLDQESKLTPHVHNSLTLRAATPGTLAWGDAERPMVFTRILLSALEGAAARESDIANQWTITLGSLSEAVATLLENLGEKEMPQLSAAEFEGSHSVRLCIPPSWPTVEARITCKPPHSREEAVLFMRGRRVGRRKPYGPGPADSEWRESVEAGEYKIELRSPRGTTVHKEPPWMMRPPITPVTVQYSAT